MVKHIPILCLVVLIAAHATGQTTPLWKTLPEIPALPHADESGLASVNDIRLYYAIFNKTGRDPVILLHGGFVSSDDWGFEVPLLSKTHTVIVVDSRGHGRSSMSAQPLTYDLMASDVLQLMDTLKIKKASIVGWSDGGITGMILAIKYPERVNKLFTFGSNYNTSGYKTEPFDSALSAKFMARSKANYARLSPTPGNFAGLRNAMVRMYSSEPNLDTADLKKITAPTVIACGEYEQFIKREHLQQLANLIPGARLVVIPNVSHGGPIQDPTKFHAAVVNLLDGN